MASAEHLTREREENARLRQLVAKLEQEKAELEKEKRRAAHAQEEHARDVGRGGSGSGSSQNGAHPGGSPSAWEKTVRLDNEDANAIDSRGYSRLGIGKEEEQRQEEEASPTRRILMDSFSGGSMASVGSGSGSGGGKKKRYDTVGSGVRSSRNSTWMSTASTQSSDSDSPSLSYSGTFIVRPERSQEKLVGVIFERGDGDADVGKRSPSDADVSHADRRGLSSRIYPRLSSPAAEPPAAVSAAREDRSQFSAHALCESAHVSRLPLLRASLAVDCLASKLVGTDENEGDRDEEDREADEGETDAYAAIRANFTSVMDWYEQRHRLRDSFGEPHVSIGDLNEKMSKKADEAAFVSGLSKLIRVSYDNGAPAAGGGHLGSSGG